MKEKSNHIGLIVIGVLLFVAVLFLCFFLPESVFGADYGYVNAEDVNVRTDPSVYGSQVVGTVSNENVSILGTAYDSSGNLWYQISYGGGSYYIFGDYVTTPGTGSSTAPAAASSFEEQLARFPASYQQSIRELHEAYPNYSFQADYVNMTFDDAVYQETLDHRKLVSLDYDGVSWRSLSPDCFNWTTYTWSTFSGNWTDAGIDVIEYYMDPRNFLTQRNMYIFAQQTYTGLENRSGVETIVGGSFLSGYYTDSTGTHSYIDAIMKAAEEANVSPYVIAATLMVEQPYWGNSPLIDGSYGYYNFFNFGAAGSDVVGNGIAYAKKQNWNTVYKSIYGGAKAYYNGYLKYGQDTYFYKDFNLLGSFDHQYAQGVYDAVSSASLLRNALSDDHDAFLVLRIPVYSVMPEKAPGYPPETSNFNPRYKIGGAVLPRTGGTISTDVPEPAEPDEPVVIPDEPQPEFSYTPGDANGDDKISALDYVAVKNHIMGRKTITDPAKLDAADANRDGKISALDYVRIKNTILER